MDITGIDYLGLDRVLKRGTGTVIEQRDQALFIHDSISGAYLLACGKPELGASLLTGHICRDTRLLMVSDAALGQFVFEKYGFKDKLECYQAAYYGETPEAPDGLSVRPAGTQDLPLLIRSYDLVSPEELETIITRGNLLLGYDREQLVGFVGEHLEGSMGLLYVFPRYRRRGYGAALETLMIARTMKAGFTPFGQIEKNNAASMALQKRLGMTVSENLIVWMWR